MIIMIIDHRERKLIARLTELNILHVVKSLIIGDVIVGKYIIELKKGGDVVGSVYDKRIFFQEAKMKYTELTPVLLIYDLKNIYESARNRNVINGLMASYLQRGNLVIPLDTVDDIIYFLQRIERDSKTKQVLKVPPIYWSFPKFKNIEERMIAALSCGEGIGYTKSKILIKKFVSLEAVYINRDQIPLIKNFGPKTKDSVSLLFTGSK